jgi:hypothetical protein
MPAPEGYLFRNIRSFFAKNKLTKWLINFNPSMSCPNISARFRERSVFTTNTQLHKVVLPSNKPASVKSLRRKEFVLTWGVTS